MKILAKKIRPQQHEHVTAISVDKENYQRANQQNYGGNTNDNQENKPAGARVIQWCSLK
jgi:hypothetical protein